MKLYLILPILLFSLTINTFSQTNNQVLRVTLDFLQSLNKEELQMISYKFDDSLRIKWTNLPVGLAKRPGLQYGALSPESKVLFHHFLTTLLSSQGYLKITSIMKLDDILNEVYETAYEKKEIDDTEIKELRDLDWNFENYFISVWGKPDTIGSWGLKFEGHHISINLSVIVGKISLTPLFLGTDPAEVHSTKYAGLRVLSKEEDYGFLLINSLSDKQQLIATISREVPKDIITNPSSPQRITKYFGIDAGKLTKDQKQILEYIIYEYVNNLEHEKSHEFIHKIFDSGFDKIYFAWIGSYESQKPHYYIINGPDFIIEYDNVGFQMDGNHIHSIWREKGNDFGEDILKTHYLEHKH